MRRQGWQMVVMLVASGTLHGAELPPGTWMMDVYRSNAPLDTVRLVVEREDEGYTVMDGEGGPLPIENVRWTDESVWFEHLDLGASCRLLARVETGEWVGTCPPDEAPRFDGGLTITLRPPRGSSLEVACDGSSPAGPEEQGSRDTR